MNIVILTGRLTADPEMKYTADGSPVANFLLAVQRMYKRDGDPKSDFIACAVLRAATAEFCQKYLRKGTKVIIHGSWRTSCYVNSGGEKVYKNNCIVSSIEFAESRRNNISVQENEPVPPPAPSVPEMPEYDVDLPFN